MDISTALFADLSELDQDLYPLTDDLMDSVRSLKRDAALAVRSLLGLTLTLTSNSQPITLTSIADWVEPADIRSSLAIDLASSAAPGIVGEVTFYAERPNAFAELAVDLTYILPVRGSNVRLDTALTPDLTSGLSGLRDLSLVNRALGVLISRGHTRQSAFDQLTQRAATPADLRQAAGDIVRAARAKG